MSIVPFDYGWEVGAEEKHGQVVLNALEEGTQIKSYGEWFDEIENLKPKKQDLARAIMDSWLAEVSYYLQREIDLENEVKFLREQLEVVQTIAGAKAGVAGTLKFVSSGDTAYIKFSPNQCMLDEMKSLLEEVDALQEELEAEKLGSSRIDRYCGKLRDTHSFKEYPEHKPDAYQPSLLLLDTGRYETGHMNRLEQWINRRGDIIQETVVAWMHIPMRDRKEV